MIPFPVTNNLPGYHPTYPHLRYYLRGGKLTCRPKSSMTNNGRGATYGVIRMRLVSISNPWRPLLGN